MDEPSYREKAVVAAAREARDGGARGRARRRRRRDHAVRRHHHPGARDSDSRVAASWSPRTRCSSPNALFDAPDVEVLLIGGILRGSIRGVIGGEAEKAVSRLRFHKRVPLGERPHGGERAEHAEHARREHRPRRRRVGQAGDGARRPHEDRRRLDGADGADRPDRHARHGCPGRYPGARTARRGAASGCGSRQPPTDAFADDGAEAVERAADRDDDAARAPRLTRRRATGCARPGTPVPPRCR